MTDTTNPTHQSCWEFRDGRLCPFEDPIQGDGDVGRAIYACGYRAEVSSRVEEGASNAEVNLYKNHEPENGRPLFYIEFMGALVGIGSVVAKDFPGLVAALNHLSGLVGLFRLDQAKVISNLSIEENPRVDP